VQFREKLAWFFGRHAEDVPDDKKFDKPELDGDSPGETAA
jgi:hypothetical protein